MMQYFYTFTHTCIAPSSPKISYCNQITLSASRASNVLYCLNVKEILFIIFVEQFTLPNKSSNTHFLRWFSAHYLAGIHKNSIYYTTHRADRYIRPFCFSFFCHFIYSACVYNIYTITHQSESECCVFTGSWLDTCWVVYICHVLPPKLEQGLARDEAQLKHGLTPISTSS